VQRGMRAEVQAAIECSLHLAMHTVEIFYGKTPAALKNW
jgi:hypothetical protein